MKKTILTLSIFLMFASSNLFAAITVSLTINTVATSTNYPGYYDVQFHGLSLNNPCSGKFTLNLQRKQIYPVVETAFSAIATFPIHQNLENLYSDVTTVQQLAGTKYEYRVLVTFDPITGGGTCNTDLNISKTSTSVIFSGAKPNFSLGSTAIVVPNLGGPVNICQSDLTINIGLCELETKYYMGVAECDLWWGVSGNYDWGHWYLNTSPNTNRSIQDEIDADLNGFTSPPVPSTDLLDGMIINGPKAGQTRYYKITIATGEPTWFSKSALIKVDASCRVTVLEVRDSDEMSEEPALSKINLYPNPVKDNLNISLESNQLINNVSLFDMNKNLVKEEKYDGKKNEAQINISALKKGLYFIAIETTDGVVRSKIVKE